MKRCLALTGLLSASALGATHPWPSQGDVIGELRRVTVQPGDTLMALGKRFDVGIHEMIQANPQIEPRRMQVGESVLIPSQMILPPKPYRQGIVINMAEPRLYFFDAVNRTVTTYPVAMGREGWRTPIMRTRVVRKKQNPTWYVPASIRRLSRQHGRVLPRVVQPGPNNPLGTRAIYLAKPSILIHGTNQANSIGRWVSSGCIRMDNHAIEDLYQRVSVGTPVTVLHRPHKLGWHQGVLYLESHPKVFIEQEASALHAPDAQASLAPYRDVLAWPKAHQALKTRHGVPVAVSQP